jgi:hypothetical protein
VQRRTMACPRLRPSMKCRGRSGRRALTNNCDETEAGSK